MKLFYLFMLLILLNGCSDFPDAGNGGSFTGVYCMLNPQVKHQDVYVVRAVNVEPFDDFLPDTLQLRVSGAMVVIKTDSQTVRFTEIDQGRYNDTAGSLIIRSGKKYTLEVETPQGETFKAVTTVPNTPVLVQPAAFDTFRVNMNIDTIYYPNPYPDTGSYILPACWIANDPIIFQWTQDALAQSFFFTIGVIDVSASSTFYIYAFRMFPLNEFIIFDTYGAFDGENWIWYGPFLAEETTREENLYIYINAFSLPLDSKNNISSNINDGFGYFGSMQTFKKPVHLIIQSKIVR